MRCDSRSVPVIATAITLAFLLAACTSTVEPPVGSGKLAPSFKALAQQYLDRDDIPMSDWDRAVVEKAAQTGSIGQADYDEGADNFEACMIAGGLRWVRTRHLNGVVEFQPPRDSPPFNVMDARAQTCLWSTGSAISVDER